MTRRLQRFLGFCLLFLCILTDTNALQCYNTSLKPESCRPIDLWCIKFINGSTVTRGCADVYDYCTEVDPGCYPDQDVNGITQKWCCCQGDLCNFSSTLSFFFSFLSFILFFWVS